MKSLCVLVISLLSINVFAAPCGDVEFAPSDSAKEKTRKQVQLLGCLSDQVQDLVEILPQSGTLKRHLTLGFLHFAQADLLFIQEGGRVSNHGRHLCSSANGFGRSIVEECEWKSDPGQVDAIRRRLIQLSILDVITLVMTEDPDLIGPWFVETMTVSQKLADSIDVEMDFAPAHYFFAAGSMDAVRRARTDIIDSWEDQRQHPSEGEPETPISRAVYFEDVALLTYSLSGNPEAEARRLLPGVEIYATGDYALLAPVLKEALGAMVGEEGEGR